MRQCWGARRFCAVADEAAHPLRLPELQRGAGRMDITADAPRVRPKLRGVLHAAGFVVAVVVGAVFVSATDGRRLVAAAVFAASAATMLGASALYHRITWSPRARPRMRRVDHAGIYILIAGTYTPVGLLSMHGSLQRTVLGVVWAGAGAAILTKICWVGAPKWLSAVFGIALGWVGIAAMPQIAHKAGIAAVALLAALACQYVAIAVFVVGV